jgi:hypothetical protein
MRLRNKYYIVPAICFALIGLIGVFLTNSEAGGYQFILAGRGGREPLLTGPMIIAIAIICLAGLLWIYVFPGKNK